MKNAGPTVTVQIHVKASNPRQLGCIRNINPHNMIICDSVL